MKLPRIAPAVVTATIAILLPAMTGQAAESPAPAPKLGSAVFTFESLTPKDTGMGFFRRVADNPTATLERFECHVTTLNPGHRSHPPHHHPQEEFIILKEGTLDVFINGHVQRVGPGSMFFFASNDVHNVTNVGSVPATYFVFNVTTAATHHVPAEPAAQSAAPQMLRSSVFDWEKLPVKATKAGERREIVDSPTVTCSNLEAHVTTLKPGESPHAAHHHPDEELILIKDGTLEATINGVSHRGGPGSIFFYGSNDQHGMRNAGAGSATYYVIRIVTAATPKAATS
jgi:quercetin dioxygenase-like cupin family protein